MKHVFGHFSEREIEEISHILKKNQIDFEIEVDPGAQEEIGQSMKNNLRYLQGATICNDLLTIKIKPEVLTKISSEDQTKLRELRLFWEEPSFSFEEESEEESEEERKDEAVVPQSFINSQESNRNGVIGMVFLATTAIALLVALFNYFQS